MLKEFAEFLEDETSLTVGTDLFAGFTPQSAPERTAIATIKDTGGPARMPSRRTAPEIDAFEKHFQIFVRAGDYHAARDLASQIHDAVHGIAGEDLPVVTSGVQWHIDSAEAVTTPQDLGQDEKLRHNFSTNFILHAQIL